jgi:predicted dehydrogenase
MSTVRCAVIGTGYLGEFHAQKYAANPDAELVAVVDIDKTRAQSVAKANKTQALGDYRDLVGKTDAVSIVTPTHSHFNIGAFCLQNGMHVLMEKPITTTVEQAQKLISLAQQYHCKLQVGYLERFNPIVVHARDSIVDPQFIESTRIMPFNPRNKDVNVVLDLMIHDIDLIQQMVGAPVTSIDASGACVLTQKIDIANARIHFANGCVANVTASRVSLKTERKMRIFQHDAYLSLDFHNKQANVCTRGKGEMFPGIPNIKRDTFKANKKADALRDEINAFIQCIIDDTPPLVSGEDGKQALASALKITDMVHAELTKRGLMEAPIHN